MPYGKALPVFVIIRGNYGVFVIEIDGIVGRMRRLFLNNPAVFCGFGLDFYITLSCS